jgi:hypothetical protein
VRKQSREGFDGHRARRGRQSLRRRGPARAEKKPIEPRRGSAAAKTEASNGRRAAARTQ